MSKQNHSINLHNTVNSANYDRMVQDTEKYGPLRVELSLQLIPILNELGLEWILDSGNLLGAYRNGKMLSHDDDFDFAIYLPNFNKDPENMTKFLIELATKIKERLTSRGLDNKYDVRIVNSYCYKLEVFQPEYGHYPLRDTNFHNVTCDLTLYLDYWDEKLGDCVQLQHFHQGKFPVPKEYFLPFGKIKYEGNEYNSPHKVKEYLEACYGYIGPNAVFDKDTGLYKPNPDLI